jgi:hypothetical protein
MLDPNPGTPEPTTHPQGLSGDRGGKDGSGMRYTKMVYDDDSPDASPEDEPDRTWRILMMASEPREKLVQDAIDLITELTESGQLRREAADLLLRRVMAYDIEHEIAEVVRWPFLPTRDTVGWRMAVGHRTHTRSWGMPPSPLSPSP